MIGLEAFLRLPENGGFSVYVSKSEMAEGFIDGAKLHRLSVTISGKGYVPGEIFSGLEKACAVIEQTESIDIDGMKVILTLCVPPSFSSFGERGAYVASCSLTADFIAEREASFADTI